MSRLHPLLQSALDDAKRLPLALSKRYVPIRECPICRTSDDHTQAGSTYCAACSNAPWTCEGCGEPMPVGGTCPCWGRL